MLKKEPKTSKRMIRVKLANPKVHFLEGYLVAMDSLGLSINTNNVRYFFPMHCILEIADVAPIENLDDEGEEMETEETLQ